MTSVKVKQDGRTFSLPVAEGALLSELLLDAGHPPEMPCGGAGRCGKCRVRVSGALSPPDAAERRALGEQALEAGVRLACRTRVLGEAAVELPSAVEAAVLLEAAARVRPKAPLFRRYGVAVDIGTTTLAARLYGPAGELARAGMRNPQAARGADVISRISYALAGGGVELRETARRAIGTLVHLLAAKAKVRAEEIDAFVLTGNTCMLYLLTGSDPECLSRAPFEASRRFGETLGAGELSLPSAPGATAYLPRCISAFVGADIVTALLAARLCDREETALLADIGTNGEVALFREGRLLCCSTAAGPAFEGAGLSCGMPGLPGAIDRVTENGGLLRFHVLGGGPARGLCGSGAVDLVAELLRRGTLEESGLFAAETERFALPEGLALTQRDVRMIQLAKSAVSAGIRTLLRRTGTPPEAVARLAVAGGFGSYLDLANAAEIGLLPRELLPRTEVLGNAALAGAAELLCDRELLARTEALADGAETVELSGDADFLEYYTAGMLFEREADRG